MLGSFVEREREELFVKVACVVKAKRTVVTKTLRRTNSQITVRAHKRLALVARARESICVKRLYERVSSINRLVSISV